MSAMAEFFRRKNSALTPYPVYNTAFTVPRIHRSRNHGVEKIVFHILSPLVFLPGSVTLSSLA